VHARAVPTRRVESTTRETVTKRKTGGISAHARVMAIRNRSKTRRIARRARKCERFRVALGTSARIGVGTVIRVITTGNRPSRICIGTMVCRLTSSRVGVKTLRCERTTGQTAPVSISSCNRMVARMFQTGGTTARVPSVRCRNGIKTRLPGTCLSRRWRVART